MPPKAGGSYRLSVKAADIVSTYGLSVSDTIVLQNQNIQMLQGMITRTTTSYNSMGQTAGTTTWTGSGGSP